MMTGSMNRPPSGRFIDSMPGALHLNTQLPMRHDPSLTSPLYAVSLAPEAIAAAGRDTYNIAFATSKTATLTHCL